MKPTWTGEIGETGRVTISLPHRKGKRVEIFEREFKKIKLRTAAQYAFLWGYVYPRIADCTGYAKYEVTDQARRGAINRLHNTMKFAFNPVEEERLNLEADGPAFVNERVGGSTTKLSCKGLSEFINLVMVYWGSEHGIEFPDQFDEWVDRNQRTVDYYYGRV